MAVHEGKAIERAVLISGLSVHTGNKPYGHMELYLADGTKATIDGIIESQHFRDDLVATWNFQQVSDSNYDNQQNCMHNEERTEVTYVPADKVAEWKEKNKPKPKEKERTVDDELEDMFA
eukprot:gnl/TRDRNA2_/TRDRNA2_201676_c0_seq1.p1 gnl/TRDRNA2_/TRDRNA2_201676_c0~~gnl/TRDRNA2_/TRDRNA2_201676_c0_seq1.p1  ORF type:complete len:136 (-),score=30.29 gnl/TRDRNA2_/TRDRNA2_201676_c0_seq1:297-656(-)